MDLKKVNKLWLVPFAVVLALALGVGIGAALRGPGGDAVASLVFLDVNPSIQLQLSRDEKVLAAVPMNDDAREVLSGMELQDTSLNVAMNAILGSLLQHGYLSGDDAAILISVEDADAQRAAKLEENLNQSVSAAVNNAQVFSQTVDAGAAQPESGVSAGVATLIREIQTMNPALDFDALAALSVTELGQLREMGAPGMPIGCAAAANAAEAFAGTLEVDSVVWSADVDLDDETPHYEITLYPAGQNSGKEFDYIVDAYSGEVLEGTPDLLKALAPVETPTAPSQPAASAPAAAEGTPAPSTPSSTPAPAPAPAPSSGTASSAISAEDAKSIAYTHAGVSAGDVTLQKCELDWDDGVQLYEIEFIAGNTEYEYEVTVSGGTILKAEQEAIQAPAAPVTPSASAVPSGGTSSGSSSGYVPGYGYGHHGGSHHSEVRHHNSYCIGDTAAWNAAFCHAGIDGTCARRLACELDWDDNVYEVEFQLDGVEYEYEIDAATGAVLKAEQDS